MHWIQIYYTTEAQIFYPLDQIKLSAHSITGACPSTMKKEREKERIKKRSGKVFDAHTKTEGQYLPTGDRKRFHSQQYVFPLYEVGSSGRRGICLSACNHFSLGTKLSLQIFVIQGFIIEARNSQDQSNQGRAKKRTDFNVIFPFVK